MTSRADYLDQEEYQNRVRKLGELRKGGVDPYPAKYEPTHTSTEVQALGQGWHASSEEAAAGQTVQVKIVGRLVLFRAMGKNAFAHLQDDLGRVQVMCNRELTKLQGFSSAEGEEGHSLKWMEKLIDLGDILGIEGHLFYTQKGELTIYAKSVTLLCKTLLPLPDKHSGLADKELRYRKRWLDLICHPEVTERLKRRSILFREIRHYFEEFAFMEVETPILQSVYGGAEARPFVTKLNALDQEMFMRISLEIPLKKLLVGGLPRVYEMGKVFRNEGIDRYHNPEFTLLEAYAACWDYRDMMSFVENLFERLALKLFGTTTLNLTCPQTQEKIILEMKAPWKRMSMKESLIHYASIDVDSWSDEEIRTRLQESGHIETQKLKTLSRGLLIASLFEVFVEPHLIQPHHIIDHPIETTPLCKLHRDPDKKEQGLVERFETFIFRHEMCNSYSELNDPLLQRELLEAQALRREKGDEEASPLDEEFLEAICQGMPPAGGIGIGLDRLVMLFTDAFSIRDVLYFPWMKPQSFTHDSSEK